MKSLAKIGLGVFAAILIIVSCEEGNIFSETNNFETKYVTDSNEVACQSDAYEIIEFVRNGDLIFIEVAYSGGCMEHEFTLYPDLSEFNKPMPILNLTLVHNSNGDLCQAYPSETLQYNLKDVLGREVPAPLSIVLNQCED